MLADAGRNDREPVVPVARPGTLDISHTVNDLGTVVRVTGELDMSTTPQFEEQVVAAATVSRPVVLDLRTVTFLGSNGLTALLRLRTRCAKAGTALRIVTERREVLRPLEITGLIEEFPLYRTVEQALAVQDTSG
jgi:anti-anti-sigma factor